MVGPDDLHEYTRVLSRPLHFCTTLRARLRPMESTCGTQERHRPREPSILRRKGQRLENGEVPHLLVCSISLLTHQASLNANIYKGTLSPRVQTSSFPLTQPAKVYTLPHAVTSTAGSSSPCSASISYRCWRAHWRPSWRTNGLGIGSDLMAARTQTGHEQR